MQDIETIELDCSVMYDLYAAPTSESKNYYSHKYSALWYILENINKLYSQPYRSNLGSRFYTPPNAEPVALVQKLRPKFIDILDSNAILLGATLWRGTVIYCHNS